MRTGRVNRVQCDQIFNSSTSDCDDLSAVSVGVVVIDGIASVVAPLLDWMMLSSPTAANPFTPAVSSRRTYRALFAVQLARFVARLVGQVPFDTTFVNVLPSLLR